MRVLAALLLFITTTAIAETRTIRATRATTPPTIDGDLSDPVWQSAPEITGFTQHDPDDGKPETESTIVKVAYDDSAIYIAALLKDSKPVTTLLGRRDNNMESDWFRIELDSQHDRLSGAEFWVNPSNVQLDGILYNDIYNDWSWDGVWQSATKIIPNVGWVAEVRIPLSQLRFADGKQQTWGVNFVRRISRRKEIDRLVNTPKSESGFVSRFADLTGLDGIHPSRAFELVPYGVARSDIRSRFDRADPFAEQQKAKMEGGLDLKYGVSSSLTLTGTINPDFGQVEVDPAVVNLSTFETFFPEKRPFFTEGMQWFKFGQGPSNSRWNFNFFGPSVFYSRRIGRAPQGSGNLAADYLAAPGDTTILGAGKLSGKIGNGWAIGVLDAVTNRESARFVSEGKFQSQQVEPLTNYLVARTTKEFNGGNSRVGFMFTSVNRDLPSELSYLRSSAYVAGVDGYKLFHKKDWLLEWLVTESMVKGSAEAIDATQRSSAHYLQRPDNTSLKYDPTRTSLTGTGARIMLNKQTGKWRANLQAQSWSPGYESNDTGFMPRADMLALHAVGYYINEDVRKHVHDTEIWVGRYMNWNHSGDKIADGLFGNWYVEANNYWYAFGNFGWDADTWDDRATRGGPLVRRYGAQGGSVGLGSDSRKKVAFETSAEKYTQKDGSFNESARFVVSYRPSSSLRLSLGPNVQRSHDATQYVTTSGTHYIFSKLEQHTVDISTRVEWTASSRLSFQLFMQPFIGTGDYHGFNELARPRSGDYTPYASAVDNPDFDFHSVRGSAVVRWEFRPGSALYVVWNENRADTQGNGDFRFRRDLRAIASAQSKDVFLVKVSYWLPR